LKSLIGTPAAFFSVSFGQTNLPNRPNAIRPRKNAMNTILRTVSLSAVIALGLFAAQPAKADHRHDLNRIDELSRRIESEGRQLLAEIRGVGFGDHRVRSAFSEVAEIVRLASRIHDAAHFGGSRRQLDRDVHALKDLVHHVEEHVDHHRHLRRHIERIDRLTHDLEDRIHDLADRNIGTGPVYSYGYRPAASGISFGGRGFSIQIGR
jgi:uncharacterized protein (UPF0335 family)